MAEHPELWTEKTPERRPLYDRTPAFGAARDLERLPQEAPPAPEPVEVSEPGRERGPFMTFLVLPWSYGERDSGEVWHRMLCRWRRHEMHGGHTMQMSGSMVFIERRCRWCGVEAAASR